MKLLSLFSGIGAPEKALHNLGIEYELIGFSEFDKYASASYCAIHDVDKEMNLGDITKLDETELPDVDLITYGFPCQDISVAGKGKGLFNEDGTKTRSGLFFDALRIIQHCKPKVAIAENVKNLTGKKFKNQFDLILSCLDEAGYNNYWKVLNAKDYGIPQNRERVFIVSIRKDVDNGRFEFPQPITLNLRLKDMLEDNVDEKFYLNDQQLSRIQHSKFTQEATRIQNENGVCGTLLSRDYKDPKCVAEIKQVAQMYPDSGNPQAGRIYATEGISPAMDTCQGGNRMPKILEPLCCASRGRNPENPSDRTPGAHTEQRLEIREDGLTNTITTVQKDNYVLIREATKKGYAEAGVGDFVNIGIPNSQTRRGRVGKSIANTLTTSPEGAVVVDDN